MINIYTDGSCDGNPGKGGWAAIITNDDKRTVVSGNEAHTTNNRMELTAVIKGLEASPKGFEVTVFSDSQYVVNTMNRNWKRKANNDLWEQLDMLGTTRNVKWKWIKGHSGHPENEEANRIAGLQSGVVGRTDYSNIGTEGFTHLDEQGQVRMVDVGNKSISSRSAVAKAFVRMKSEIIRMILNGDIPKGDVLACARLAGIMAAKQTSSLIPLCHPIELNQVKIDLDCDESRHGIEVIATVSTNARTGVEMEALTAVTISSLTIYDMCKSVDKGIFIEEIMLVSKHGGKSGDYIRDV